MIDRTRLQQLNGARWFRWAGKWWSYSRVLSFLVDVKNTNHAAFTTRCQQNFRCFTGLIFDHGPSASKIFFIGLTRAGHLRHTVDHCRAYVRIEIRMNQLRLISAGIKFVDLNLYANRWGWARWWRKYRTYGIGTNCGEKNSIGILYMIVHFDRIDLLTMIFLREHRRCLAWIQHACRRGLLWRSVHMCNQSVLSMVNVQSLLLHRYCCSMDW